MSKKLIGIGAALALALVFTLSMAGGDAVAGSGSARCSKSASVASAGCSRTASFACTSGKAAVAGYTKASATSAETPEEHAAALKGIVSEIPYRESKRMVIAGNMACGSCSYDATASCAPLFKTVDGKVYPLVPGQLVDRMKNAESTNGFEVTTRVKKMDGVKYLDVLAFKAL